MCRTLARWLAVVLLGLGIALGSTPHTPFAATPAPVASGDPGNGSGGGG